MTPVLLINLLLYICVSYWSLSLENPNTHQNTHLLVKLEMQPVNNQNSKEPGDACCVLVVPPHPCIDQEDAVYNHGRGCGNIFFCFQQMFQGGYCSHALCCRAEAPTTHLQ